MDNDEEGEIIRLEHGFLVDEEDGYVVHDDVLEQEENHLDSMGCGNIPLREQDRFLPIANIAKIMKRAIPENGKIAKDARECVQECISEFISFVTSEASDRCQVEKRKTINGEDVLFALNNLGFDNYVEPLKLYLKKYRSMLMTPAQAGSTTVSRLSEPIIIYEVDASKVRTGTRETILPLREASRPCEITLTQAANNSESDDGETITDNLDIHYTFEKDSSFDK